MQSIVIRLRFTSVTQPIAYVSLNRQTDGRDSSYFCIDRIIKTSFIWTSIKWNEIFVSKKKFYGLDILKSFKMWPKRVFLMQYLDFRYILPMWSFETVALVTSQRLQPRIRVIGIWWIWHFDFNFDFLCYLSSDFSNSFWKTLCMAYSFNKGTYVKTCYPTFN